MAIFQAVSPPFPRNHPSFWGPSPPGPVWFGVFLLNCKFHGICIASCNQHLLKGKNSGKGSWSYPGYDFPYPRGFQGSSGLIGLLVIAAVSWTKMLVKTKTWHMPNLWNNVMFQPYIITLKQKINQRCIYIYIIEDILYNSKKKTYIIN